MSLKTVCRFCLTMDVPMRVLADSRLLEVYEKLSSPSLYTVHWPVLACYLCFSQLRKCHNLMIRSVKIEKLLTKLHQSGDMLKDESITMLSHVRNEISNSFCCTPVETMSIEEKRVNHVKIEVKEEPVVSQCTEDMYLDPSFSVKKFKGNEPDGESDVKAAKVESPELIDDELDLKYEALEDMIDIDEHDLAYQDVQHKGSEVAKSLKTMKEDAARDDKWKRSHTETQDREQNIPEKQKLRTNKDKETSNTNITTYTLKNIIKGTVIQVLRHSDTETHRGNVSVDSDDDCTGTNTDVDGCNSEHLTNLFICDYCGNTFDDKYLLTEHIEHHNESTSHPQSSRGVVKKHSNRCRLKCDICHRRFTRKYNLTMHLTTHTGEKSYKCSICQRGYTQRGHLIDHLRTHTKEKPFKCSICQCGFTLQYSLTRHLRTHTNKKPLKCSICQRGFNEPDGLKRHLRTHNNEKPFICSVCQRGFTQQGSLKRHFERRHTERFKCLICQRGFTQKSVLKRHMRTCAL